MCVVVRDLIVFGVLTDMMRGPARGLRDVRELRRGRPPLRARARRHAGGAAQARPAVRPDRRARGGTRRVRTRSSCSPTTARPRAPRSSSATATGWTSWSSARSRRRAWTGSAGGDEQSAMVAPRRRRGDRPQGRRQARRRTTCRAATVVVLGSGNLGLVYLMEEQRRLTLEEIDERHPELIPALRAHPHVGWLLVRSAEQRRARARRGRRAPPRRRPRSRARTRSPPFSPTAAQHLAAHGRLRATSPTSWSASFYDPALDEGCAFEELISFHGGLGGPQTRPFILAPPRLAAARTSRSSAPRPCTAAAGGLAARTLQARRISRAARSARARAHRVGRGRRRRTCGRRRWPAS